MLKGFFSLLWIKKKKEKNSKHQEKYICLSNMKEKRKCCLQNLELKVIGNRSGVPK